MRGDSTCGRKGDSYAVRYEFYCDARRYSRRCAVADGREDRGAGDLRAHLSGHCGRARARPKTRPHRHRYAGRDRHPDLWPPADERHHWLHQLADNPAAVWLLCAIGPTAVVRIFRRGGEPHCTPTGKSRAFPVVADVGHGGAFGIPEPRHRLFRVYADCSGGVAATATQSGSVPDRPGDCQQHWRGGYVSRQSAGHDDRAGCRAGLRPLHHMVHCTGVVRTRLRIRYHLDAVAPSTGRHHESPTGPAGDPHPFNRPHTIKGLIILAIVIGLFFSPLPKEIVALTAAAIHLASPMFRTEDLLKLVEWPILVLFMSLFVVTGAFQSTGYGEQAVQWLASQGLHLQSLPTLALVTAALSNLIGNSGAVMLLLNVAKVTQPPAAYVLALANSFGGSLLIVGSVSTIIVVQQARQLGIRISFRDFARLGVPVTLAALGVLVGWVLLIT